MNKSPKILIIRLSSLGDILHTLPAFAGLRASFPDAKIDWLVAGKFRFLLSAVRGIDEIHCLETKPMHAGSGNRYDWPRIWNTIRYIRARHYDFSIDFQGLLKTAFLGFTSGSKTRFGFSKDLVREPPAHWFYHQTLAKPEKQVHVLTLNQMLAGLAGAQLTSTSCDFDVAEDDQRAVESLISKNQLTDFIVINPGGGWFTKRWDPARYGLLAKRIREETGLPVVVTTGPGEDELYRTMEVNCGKPVPFHFPVSFLQLIPLLQKTRLLIGGDTGPFHLACALGTPTVGIFGPTSPVRNGPWQDGDEVVVHELPCSSCYGRTCDTNNECMDISVDEVFSAVVRRLENQGGASFANR
jgi:lipopolysaccharide heptosyltransferase I